METKFILNLKVYRPNFYIWEVRGTKPNSTKLT